MNKFFKRLALLLAVLMIVSMMPVQLFADNSVIVEGQSNGTVEASGNSNAVATVNGVGYASLAEAIANATPDANGVITYEISGKATVDSTGWIQVARADLTGLTKVEFVGKTSDAEICITGGLAILADQNYDIDVSFEALTLSKPNPAYGGDYGHSTNYFTTWLRNTNAAENTVTYTNCTFPNGLCNNQYGNTVVDGCTFSNTTTGMYNFWNYGGNTEIKNSTFTGVRGIKTYNEGTLAVAPTVKIENTTFDGLTEKAAIVTSKATDITLDNVSATDCGKGFFQKDIEGSSKDEKITITANGSAISGTFNITADKTTAAAKEEFNISAGTFTSEVSSDYLADGFEVKDNGDGTYGVAAKNYVATIGDDYYSTLQEAIDAAKSGAIVTLLSNTRENVTISKKLTLDLNGFTLNGGTEKGKPALTITARIVTIKDSSEAQTGTIMRDDTAENSGVSSHYVIDIQGNGWVMFESGKVMNNSGTTEGKGASLVRVGDDSVAKQPGLVINGGSFTQDNFIVIKVDRGYLTLNGGTLTSANSYAIENWFRATIKGGTVNGAVSSWTYSSGSNSTLEISGGTINGNVESVSYDGSVGKKAKVSITGGTVNGTLSTKRYDSTTAPGKDMATIEITGGTFSSDPTKYVIEDFAITKNDDGTFGVGVAKAYLARIGETSYYTMEDAFEAQTDGDTIVLLRDYTTGSPFRSGSINRTVDLNGHTWTCTGTATNSAAFEINNPNVTLTVKNGKIVSSQLVGLIPSASGGVSGGTITYDNSSLVFEGVEMSTTATSGIETNGNNTNDTVTLKNSTLNVPNGFGIYFPSSGKLTLDNSTVNAKTMGVQVCAGSLSINEGSAVTVTGDAVPKAENDGAIQDGAAISVVNRTGYKGLGTVTVSGGKFTAKEGNSAIKAYDWANKTESDFTADKGTVAVSGGTFSSAVPADLCAEGLVPVANTDGTYGVKAGKYVAQIGDVKYETLADALAAANAGDTVTLLADINTPEKTYEITKSLTIDLNGKTVTGSGYDGVFEVTGENIKVVLDATNGGKVIAVENSGSAGKYAMAVWMCGAGSTLTINGGEFIQNITSTNDKQMDMIYASAGTIIINSGSFTSGTPKWTLNINDSAYKNGTANIIVNGGTFTGYDPRNAENEGNGTSLVADGVGIDKNADGTFTAKSGMAAQIVDADGNSVAAYATLADAIAAANAGETVKLLADVTADVVIDKNITLDLGGKTLNGGTGNTKATITNYGTITITDSSAEKTGTIKRDDNGTEGETSYYVIRNFGTMTIEQANIINNSGYKKTNPSGSMVGSSLICNGDDDAYSAVLNIKGGTIRQDNFIAIKNGSSATLNVTGGKITSKHSAVQNWCNANITGGELNGQLWTDSWDSNSTGNTVMGGDAKFTGEIVIDITGSIVPKFEITGGTLDVTNWRITTEAANAGAKPAVSGGKFSSAVPEEYCAEGFIPTKNADGTYGVKEGMYVAQIGDVKYETLEEAFAAAKNGDTITLLEDCKSDRINLEDKSVTVVLNGKTLTSTAAYGVMFCAKNGNKITIDGTVEGSKLVGTLMITSGTDGHIEVNGGTYESSQYCPIYVNGSVSSENSTVTVKNAIIQAINRNSDQDSGCGVYLAGYSTSVFENCTITAPITGIEIRAGKLTLNNCNVTGGNGEVTEDANGNGTTVTNAALAISQHNTKKPIDVTIDGGTFNGTAAVYQTDVQGTGSANVKIAVKSGTFNGTISGETDGTIAISGGKFKFKVDDKYFANGHVCSGNPGADGYYTIADHPIISAGLTISADMSFRVKVRSGYKNGSLRYYYDTIGENNTIVRVEGEGILGATDAEGNSIFRIYNVNPQRADLVYTFQYYDAEGNAVGTPKQRSVIAYFEDFYNLPLGDNEDLDAKKTFIANFLEYCASAMERSYYLHNDVTLNGKTWQDRADAVREMMTRLGLVATNYEFKGNLGRYYSDNVNGVIIERGVAFGSTFKVYYAFSKATIDNGYRVFRQGMDVTDKLELVDGAYRLYFELAPYEFKDNLTITVNNGTTKVCEYTSPLANTLEVLSKSADASVSKMAKAAFNYFVALQNYNG